ncbi:feather beta keratin-like [Corvus cornix cornix]|uniref:feather beta keratin-like n=1 Tax=Corvus cornix cornix TaxID=932674 RepID=UPI0019503B2E|nr:feather beta keratin-like [Corvus cornix cornix]
MACYNRCQPCGPTPLANSCNEPCALQCQDSSVVIPFPRADHPAGPIMTSFPQNTAVGSTSSAALGSELSAQGQPISGGFGLGYGLGGLGCYGRRGGYIC